MSHWKNLFILTLFAAGWLIADYLQLVWGAGHYQFAPLMFVAVALLLYFRFDDISTEATKPSGAFVAMGFFTACLTLLAGHLFRSGELGIVGLIIGMFVIVYGRFGRGGLRHSLAPLSLLFFAIPLPFNLDEDLVVEMQFVASYTASKILDGIGMIHFRDGVILVTQNGRFQTEEACSGIRSLFSSLAVVATFCVAMRFSFLRTIFNLVQTLMWVLIGNAIRVALVVFLADNVSTWFARGIGHELIGILVFVFIIAMVGALDHFWNFAVYGATTSPTDGNEEVDPYGEEDFENGTVPEKKLPKKDHVQLMALLREFKDSRFPLGGTVTNIARACLLTVGLIGLWVGVVRTGIFANESAAAVSSLSEPQGSDFPETLNGWERRGFEHIKRDGISLFASNSFVWTYAKGDSRAFFSIDRPWDKWHNLNVCYRGIGWESRPEYAINIAENASPCTRLRLARSGKEGFVLFSSVDRLGRPVPPNWRFGKDRLSRVLTTAAARAATSLGFSYEGVSFVTGIRLPASTLQLYSDSATLTDQDRLEMERLFLAAREHYLATYTRMDTAD